jgi:hypothetical protein
MTSADQNILANIPYLVATLCSIGLPPAGAAQSPGSFADHNFHPLRARRPFCF